MGSYCGGFSCSGAGVLGCRAHECGLSSCSFRALEHRFNTCGAQAYLLYGMWDLPGPGIEPVSLHWKADSLPLSHQGSHRLSFEKSLIMDGDEVERPFQKGKKV